MLHQVEEKISGIFIFTAFERDGIVNFSVKLLSFEAHLSFEIVYWLESGPVVTNITHFPMFFV